jgi:hypothetical protein
MFHDPPSEVHDSDQGRMACFATQAARTARSYRPVFHARAAGRVSPERWADLETAVKLRGSQPWRPELAPSHYRVPLDTVRVREPRRRGRPFADRQSKAFDPTGGRRPASNCPLTLHHDEQRSLAAAAARSAPAHARVYEASGGRRAAPNPYRAALGPSGERVAPFFKVEDMKYRGAHPPNTAPALGPGRYRDDQHSMRELGRREGHARGACAAAFRGSGSNAATQHRMARSSTVAPLLRDQERRAGPRQQAQQRRQRQLRQQQQQQQRRRWQQQQQQQQQQHHHHHQKEEEEDGKEDGKEDGEEEEDDGAGDSFALVEVDDGIDGAAGGDDGGSSDSASSDGEEARALRQWNDARLERSGAAASAAAAGGGGGGAGVRGRSAGSTRGKGGDDGGGSGPRQQPPRRPHTAGGSPRQQQQQQQQQQHEQPSEERRRRWERPRTASGRPGLGVFSRAGTEEEAATVAEERAAHVLQRQRPRTAPLSAAREGQRQRRELEQQRRRRAALYRRCPTAKPVSASVMGAWCDRAARSEAERRLQRQQRRSVDDHFASSSAVLGLRGPQQVPFDTQEEGGEEGYYDDVEDDDMGLALV